MSAQQSQNLPIDSAEEPKFYCDKIGFEKRFEFRLDDSKDDPCYMGLMLGDAWIHVTSFSGDGMCGSAVYLIVDDVDDIHSKLVAAGVEIDLEPTDQTWGNRETYVKDPDGNSLRFVQERS